MKKTAFCVVVEDLDSVWKVDHQHWLTLDEALWLTLDDMEVWVISKGVCTIPLVPYNQRP